VVAVIRLHLVRHGSTDRSDAGRFNGTIDVSLNETGRSQARALATTLEGRSFAGVWTSDLVRCVETAALAWGTATVDPRLRELDFGELEGRIWDELDESMRQELIAFESFSAPGGESVDLLRARVARFVGDLSPGDHLVFTHGGVIRSLLRAHGGDRRVEPGSLVVVDLESLGPGPPRVG
jgi:probable phosphoglycerate mutase